MKFLFLKNIKKKKPPFLPTCRHPSAARLRARHRLSVWFTSRATADWAGIGPTRLWFPTLGLPLSLTSRAQASAAHPILIVGACRSVIADPMRRGHDPVRLHGCVAICVSQRGVCRGSPSGFSADGPKGGSGAPLMRRRGDGGTQRG